MSDDLLYGLLSYDIPYKDRTTYAAVRKKIRRVALPITWSCYLIPWGMRDELEALMKAFGSKGIRYSLVKFDNSEKGKLDQLAKECLQRIVMDWKDALRKCIRELEEGEKDLDDSTAVLVKSRKNLEMAKSLALTFMLTSDANYALASFSKIIDESAERIKEKRGVVNKKLAEMEAAAKKKEK